MIDVIFLLFAIIPITCIASLAYCIVKSNQKKEKKKNAKKQAIKKSTKTATDATEKQKQT
jgi:preprotein translocase subunit YajC